MSEFLDAYTAAIIEKYYDEARLLLETGVDSNGANFSHHLKIKWRGLHQTRCELMTINHRGDKIWYSTAKGLEEIHDDLNDPRSLDRLDRLVHRMILAAKNTENEVLSLRGQTNGTQIRPPEPRTGRRDPEASQGETPSDLGESCRLSHGRAQCEDAS